MVHASVAEQWGGRNAAWINGLAFAGIHLLHHGLLIDSSGVHVRSVSGALWFSLMVALSGVFNLIREKSGSLWPGVVAHAVFNLFLNVTIFLFLM